VKREVIPTLAVQPIDVLKFRSTGTSSERDVAAAEEPLEIRLQGTTFVVTMRTPGDDRELAAGFLLSERIVHHASDFRSLTHCTRSVDAGNVLNVSLSGDAAARAVAMLAERRLVATTSACGICGRRSIDDLMQAVPRISARLAVARDVVLELPRRLRRHQPAFQETGGLHAAALFDSRGMLVTAAEDVGRHNAVDKVIGRQLLAQQTPLSERVLFVSGRTSFEIVQKAIMAGVPVVASVSAPSSLAVSLAREAGVTLIGFVRDIGFNVYASADRIT
jgi:FdhD protein